MKKLATAVIFGLLMVNISVSAQNLKKGKFGLGIDGVETTTRFAAKYYLSDKFAVEAIGWFDMSSPKENTPAGQIKVDGVNYVAWMHFTILIWIISLHILVWKLCSFRISQADFMLANPE